MDIALHVIKNYIWTSSNTSKRHIANQTLDFSILN